MTTTVCYKLYYYIIFTQLKNVVYYKYHITILVNSAYLSCLFINYVKLLLILIQ